MSDQVSRKFRSRRLTRRSVLQSSAALLSAPFVEKANAVVRQEKLAGTGEVVVCSYGGLFTENLRKYVSDPFTKATGITVVDVSADNAEPQVKAMREAGRVDWDIAFVNAFWPAYLELQQAGAFMPIDYSLWDDEALKGVPEYARKTHSVVGYTSTHLLIYDERIFPRGGPKNWTDFWNIKEFPGARGLSASSYLSNISFALSADGVPNKGLWRLTDDMVDRALKKLDEIRPHIVKWWIGGETIPLLINGEYAMTSGYDGRALASIKRGAPIRMVWDGGSVADNDWVVLRGGPNSANAQKFIAFVNRAEVAAGFTLGTGYPSSNLNQLKHLPTDLGPLLSISPESAAKVVRYDVPWFLEKRADGKTNVEHLHERWLAWRAQ